MFDAKTDERVHGGAGEAFGSSPARKRLPVLIILHQEQSSPGHVGHELVKLGYPLDIRRPRFGDPLPETMEQHAGAVIFGGPMSANDPDDFIRRETDWIGVPLREARPFLGICLGGQMLARLLGAPVTFNAEGHVEIGYHDIVPTAEATARFGTWPTRVYQWHREGFGLAHGAVSLATASGSFQLQAFGYGPAAIGVQFHPEMTYAMMNRWSGSNPMRLHLRGAQPRAEQLQEHMLAGRAVRQWLAEFLETLLSTEDSRQRITS